MTGCEVRRGLVAVAVAARVGVVVVVAVVAAVVAEEIAGAGSKEGGWGSRRGFGAGESGWRFAVVAFVGLAEADADAVDADPIHRYSWRLA